MPKADARTAVQRLVDARAAIDAWDSEFTPAPWHLYFEATEALAELDPDERARVVELLADPYLRCEAAYACGVLTLHESRDGLVAGLRDREQQMRDACAAALLRVTPEMALSAIADAGTVIDRDTVDRAALAAIDTLGADAASLLEQINHAPTGSSGAWARLYELHRDAVIPVLERGVRGATFAWVYGAHQLVLHCGGGAWARPAFLPLATHPDQRLARLASDVLGKVGDADSLETMLVALTAATHPWQRGAAIRGILDLGRTTQTPIAQRVIPLASSKPDEQRLLMLGLAALGEAPWEARAQEAITRAIRAALVHADEEVVTVAIRAALAHRLASLAPDVIGTFGHACYYDNEMRAARAAFMAWAPEASVAALTAAVERGLVETADTHAVELAARALVKLDARQHAALIAHAFAAGDFQVRNAAAAMLGSLGLGDERDALVELVKQGPADVTEAALRALERVGDRRGIGWLARRAKERGGRS